MTTATTFAGYDDSAAQPLPSEESLPFTFLFGPRANLAILLVLFVLTLGFTSSLVALAHAYGYSDQRSIEIYKLITLCGVALGQIMLLIRSQGNAEGIRRTRHEIKGDLQAQTMLMQEVAQKTNGGLTKAVKEVGEQVRAAEREQAVFDLLENPKFADLLRQTVESTCDEWDKRKGKAG